MQRPLHRLILFAFFLGMVVVIMTQAQSAPEVFAPEPDYTSKRPRDFSAFESALASFTAEQAATLETLLQGKTVLEVQALLQNGALTSERLVLYAVYRIRRDDIDQLNSVMELNPQALEIARALDAERANGEVRGTLHGIPVLLKDNICTGDGMHCTAGAAALADFRASRDAFLAIRLREAGAIILGKTNLSEWANWMTEGMPNGFSTLGGQTRNPYGRFDPLGSSSGSAVAVAAGFVMVSVGTETSGSITAPAAANSIVGLKPSRGLVSRDGIIPLAEPMDTAGPMGRTVTDVAVLFNALVGVDANDATTEAAAQFAGTDFTQVLDLDTARGMRVGVLMYGEQPPEAFRPRYSPEALEAYAERIRLINDRQQAMIPFLEAAGMQAIFVENATDRLVTVDYRPILEYGFKHGLNDFLADFGAPITSLEAIIAFNEADLPNRAPYGQSYIVQSQNTTITEDEYTQMAAHNRQITGDAITELLRDLNLDVLLTQDNMGAFYYAPAGFPALTVPGGYDEFGRPFGATFVGDAFSEARLLTAAYAFEQASRVQRPPVFD
jgi:amidase